MSSLSPLRHALWHCVPGAPCLHATVLSAHHGRADCSSQERPHHPLLPSLLSPQLLPWVSYSGSSFFCPRFFSLPMDACPSLPSQPQSSSFYKAVPSDRIQTLHLPKKPALFPLYIRRQRASSGCSTRYRGRLDFPDNPAFLVCQFVQNQSTHD